MTNDSYCDICYSRATSYYHCETCPDEQADICLECFYLDNWCKNHEHILRLKTREDLHDKKDHETSRMSFSSVPKQEISILNMRSVSSKPRVLFSRRSWAAIDSQPAFHPLQPMFFLLIDHAQLLVGDCSNESFLIRTLKSSPKSKLHALPDVALVIMVH